MKGHSEFHKNIERDIAKSGRSIVCVCADADSKCHSDFFAYTVGNSIKGLPELLTFGVSRDSGFLNALSEIMIDRGRFSDGEIVDLGGKLPLCVVDAIDDVKDLFTIQVGEHFGTERYDVMQVVIPDRAGLFPWQHGCAEPFRSIHIYRRLQA